MAKAKAKTKAKDGKKRLVVAVTGASGSVLAIDLLEQIRKTGRWETHVVVSDNAALSLEYEMPDRRDAFASLADHLHDMRAMDSPLASGTFRTAGMVVAPCSMKTLAGINGGYSDNLILRAADVTLKERRPLVLAVRESPLSRIHLRNMAELGAMGAVIMPPMMSFYSRPQTIDEMVRQFTGKVMDVFGEEPENLKRWGESAFNNI